MAQYVSSAVHLKHRIIQLFCCHILAIAVQVETQTRIVLFKQLERFDVTAENANDTIFNISGEGMSCIECVFFCSKHDKCKSVFFYEEEDNVCQLRNSTLNNMTERVAKAGARYYKRVENPEELSDHRNDAVTTELKRIHECNYVCTVSESRTVICQPDTTFEHIDYECQDILNVALKRDATQSSTYYSHYASEAVDGIRSSLESKCMHTDEGDEDRWWMVNFGQTAVVLGVSMLNRDICEKRMSDISIWIGSSLDLMELCAYYGGPGITEETALVMCSTHMIGQYLKLTGGGQDDYCYSGYYLQLCEIQAMGIFPAPLTCGEGLFECHTNLCTADDTHCDLINDCGDWSDEVGCSCSSNAFQCNSGACIPFYFRCNGADDCVDGSDEPADCVSCDGSLCTDDICIPDSWICDNWDDCGDNSDEMGCF